MKLSDLIPKEEIVRANISLNDEEIDFIGGDPEKLQGKPLLIVTNASRIKGKYDHLKKSFAIIIYNEGITEIEYDKSVTVKDIRKCAAIICYRFYNPNLKRLKIIGISGTNGKSTTAMLIKMGIESQGHTVGLIGTGQILIGKEKISDDNYSMTTPDPWDLYRILKKMEDCNCDHVVMEVSSHALELKKVMPIRFDIGVFTNLSMEHLDFHSCMEDYYLAKKKLYESSEIAVVNIDDSYGRRLAGELGNKAITTGILWRGNEYAASISAMGFDGCSYYHHGNGFCCKINLHIPGIHNIYNALQAMAVCNLLGIKPKNVKKAFSDCKSLSGRYEIIKGAVTVIIDYAHTISAMENLLSDMASSKSPTQRLITVFGCGGERDKSKRPRMAEIAEKYSSRIIVTTDNSRRENPLDIIDNIISGFSRELYEIIPDRKKAIRSAILTAQDGDIIALIGKGPERYNINAEGYQFFDEKEIVNEAMRDRL